MRITLLGGIAIIGVVLIAYVVKVYLEALASQNPPPEPQDRQGPQNNPAGAR